MSSIMYIFCTLHAEALTCLRPLGISAVCVFSNDKLQCLAEGFSVQEQHLKKQPLIHSLK